MTNSPTVSVWYAGMQQACAESLPLAETEWSFKSDSRYRDILEHVEPQQGEQILAALPIEFPEHVEVVRQRLPAIAAENDSIGRPFRAGYPSVPVMCSPQNLQYVFHALLLLRYLQKLGTRAPNVVEIGGGYGGMALYTFRLADLFDIDIQTYTIVDIPMVLEIQSRFCAALGITVETIDGSDANALQSLVGRIESPFAFSSYGFAEFDPAMRDWYVECLLQYCPHGLMIWNAWNGWPHIPPNYVYPFLTDRPIHVIDDHVPEYPGQDIKDVYW